jgi:hypothetical protein
MRPRPYGLRNTCLKVRYLALSRVATLAGAALPSALRTVAQWRINNPDQFQALCDLLQIPKIVAPSRTILPPRKIA